MKKIIIVIILFSLTLTVYAKVNLSLLDLGTIIAQQDIDSTDFRNIQMPVNEIKTTLEEQYKLKFEVNRIAQTYKISTTTIEIEWDLVKNYNVCREDGNNKQTCKQRQISKILSNVKSEKNNIRREMEELKSKDYSNEWVIEDFTFTKNELTNQ